jgi:hypothetical protein
MIELECYNCGITLEVDVVGGRVKVRLCDYCISEAKEEARHAGYEDGYNEAEDAFGNVN